MKKTANKKSKQICFELTANPGDHVYVAGTFNEWSPTANPMKDNPDSGHFKTAILLQPGHHEYKFIVNDSWCADPQCSEFEPNDLGTINSVINV